MKRFLKVSALALFGFCLSAQSPMVRATSGAADVLLGKLTTGNFNVTTDQSITITLPTGITKYVVRHVVAGNASISLTTAVGGLYTAASKGGSALVAAAQAWSAVTGSTKFVDATLAAVATTDIRTETTLFFSLTVAQGAAATADVYIYGDLLP